MAGFDNAGPDGSITGNQVTIITGAAGTATITATSGNGRTVNVVTATIDVTVVPVPVRSITISGPANTVAVGNPLPLTATVTNTRGAVTTEYALTWSSSNQAFATVDQRTGVVTGVAKGPATITATAGGVTATFAIQVVDPPSVAVSTIRIDSGLTVVQAAKTIEVTATAVASGGTLLTDRTIAWASRAVGKAAVAPKGANGTPAGPNGTRTGVVAGDQVGKAWIVAESEGKRDSIEVTVIPGDLDRIIVTPGSTSLRVGSSRQLTAEARDIKDNRLPTASFVWSSASPAVATIGASDGVVTAVAQGTTEIRATIGTVTGLALVSVSPRRIAYGVGNQPSSGAAYPAALAFNSTGGAITVARQGTGSYRVTFGGLRPQAGETETILVSRYGEGNHYCKLAGEWAAGATNDLVANVLCFTYAGGSIDAEFSIMLLGDDILFGRFGYALANQPSAAGPYTPSNSYNSGPANPPPVSVQRVATGHYRVSFPGNGGGPNDPEAFHVTAVGPTNIRCNIAQHSPEVEVRCYAPTGRTPMDSPFAITLLDRGRGGALRAGYAWAADLSGEEYETPGVYTLSSVRAYNSSLGVVELTKLPEDGRYEVVFRGLVPSGGTPTFGVQVVDRDADEPMFCNVVGWSIASPDLRVTVQCWHSANGEPEDESFYVIVIQ